MILKLLQLNINSDNYWEQLTTFLSSHDFDIIQLQEVTGKDTVTGNVNSKREIFIELQKILGENYYGELAISQRYTSSPESYMGNATFYRKAFPLIEKHIVVLAPDETPFPSEATTYEGEGRTLLHLKLQIGDNQVSFLNVHFAWAKSPKEESHQTEQGRILLTYLQTVPHLFVLSGDFNLNSDQPVIKYITKLARNLTTEHNLTNTLNPRIHRAKQLFPPGVAVDYIFTSPAIDVQKFSVIEEDISDHFGLTAEIEI